MGPQMEHWERNSCVLLLRLAADIILTSRLDKKDPERLAACIKAKAAIDKHVTGMRCHRYSLIGANGDPPSRVRAAFRRALWHGFGFSNTVPLGSSSSALEAALFEHAEASALLDILQSLSFMHDFEIYGSGSALQDLEATMMRKGMTMIYPCNPCTTSQGTMRPTIPYLPMPYRTSPPMPYLPRPLMPYRTYIHTH